MGYMFSDGTGRHQTAIQNLIIGVIDEERLHPLIISTSIILKGKTSEQQVDDVLSNIVGYGKRFHKWVEVLEHSHSSYQNDIP